MWSQHKCKHNIILAKNWSTDENQATFFPSNHQLKYALARVIKCRILIGFIAFSFVPVRSVSVSQVIAKSATNLLLFLFLFISFAPVFYIWM